MLPDPPLPADAYADAAQVNGVLCPSLLGSTVNASTGAPDGNLTVLGVGVGCSLLLDFGRDEEGLGNLTIYYSGVAVVGAGVTVSLLDADLNPLASSSSLLNLSLLSIPQTATLSYSGVTPYRYVRFSNLLGLGLITSANIVDAVQAQYYNGSDTDGDGVITNCPTPGPGQECASDSDNDGIPAYLDNDGLNNGQTQKLVSPAMVRVGSLVTYEIVLHNTSVVTLTPTITDEVPAPLQIVSAVPSGTQTSNTLVWSGVEVPPGTLVTITLVTRAPYSGTVPYTVTNSFAGVLPAEFSYNRLPVRTAPVLVVSPYYCYVPIVMRPEMN